MLKKTGYKEMLRDRVPEVVDFALKWCKAKQCWIDHVYESFIGIYLDKENRYATTRMILGLSSKYRKFNFHETIHWDNLTDEEKADWTNIEEWVSWFREHYQDVTSHVESWMNDKEKYEAIYEHINTTDDTLRKNLASYLLKCVKST